ncbi:MAG: bifunctional adenosylcobinamide kinase/adenosylcobinamide-phosphate guanylyltransferase [Peptostreptococcaceae bacterium]|nr:bifunctional adenosylcobinamide kinase/adenosylcobinamide-phosphate guanylyltransferase [Peptostreptococcaceae bacterium]
MNYFISGGCKNGKSFHAQRVAKKMSEENGLPLYYIATMIPIDEEDNIRIDRHISERAGWGFETIEQPVNILGCLDKIDNKGVFLFDSVTALLMNEMFPVSGEPNLGAAKKIAKELEEFCSRTDNTVFVSDYIYSDCNKFDDLTDKYREGLALLDKTLAKACGQVVEVAYGFTKVHK